jgi:epoxyqueuosine reductase QueG
LKEEVFHVKHNELFQRSGAAAWGTCAFADLTLPPGDRERALSLCPDAAGVYVAAFPYYAGDRPGNLSLYARGEDYHRSLLRRLEPVCEGLRALHPGHRFVPGTDSSPLDERQCARLARVGIQGLNGLIIVEPYGSWVFLGTILTDLPLPSAKEPSGTCIQCGACVRACPGGALRTSPFDESRCLSALTQKKGQLTPEEETLLAAHPLIWGCDICQRVCPYNKDVLPSPLRDLSGEDSVPYLSSLSQEDLEGLSNRTFRAKYGDRAFAWRGPAVLRRNLSLKK